MKLMCCLKMGFSDVMSLCSLETKWPTLKKLHGFSVSFYVFNVVFKRFLVNKGKNARIGINQVLFQCSNILWISRKVFEHGASALR